MTRSPILSGTASQRISEPRLGVKDGSGEGDRVAQADEIVVLDGRDVLRSGDRVEPKRGVIAAADPQVSPAIGPRKAQFEI